MESLLTYWDRSPHVADRFKTGVSLHSHTLHSEESVLPLGQYLRKFACLRGLLQHAHRSYGERSFEDDLSRIWWTPPLAPRQALEVEALQIEGKLGLDPIVSISDHDSIDAPVQLQVLGRTGSVPISVEWSVPYRQTYFHIGVHNLPAQQAASGMEQMARFTKSPVRAQLAELFSAFSAHPGCLIVFNHPYWDQPVIGDGLHERLLLEFVEEFRLWIHALEINGLRDWRENQRTVQLSRRYGMPLVSGGDRHGREPNAALNLTNATDFGEFASEVRTGLSHVVIMPQYRRPLPLRFIENFSDIVSDAPDHGLGWTHWTQRVFRRCDDGEVRTLGELHGNREPVALAIVTAVFRLLCNRYVGPALERAMPPTRELG